MHREGDYRSFHAGTARGVELPYGGDAFTAVAVLSAWGYTLAEIVASLDARTWADWMAQLDKQDEGRETVVELPRFQLQYERGLDDDLKALGIPDAFSKVAADFTRLTPVDLPAGEGPPWVWVSRAWQKTFLKVDEEGTEAAAATAVEVSFVDSGPPTFRFDQPFLFAIRERFSGTILFIGVIGDPS